MWISGVVSTHFMFLRPNSDFMSDISIYTIPSKTTPKKVVLTEKGCENGTDGSFSLGF